MKVHIRRERPSDFDAIRLINNLAFGRDEEGRLVDNLRQNNKLIISLVAVRERAEAGQHQEIIGHIAFSPATLDPQAGDISILCLGPVAVLPDYQNQGVGSQLTKEGLKRCRDLGCSVVVLVGHPEYYPRFGFVRARPLGIECEYPQAPDDAWMLLELRKGALAGCRGRIIFQPEFREGVPTG
jgi:putative acetyltransferase